jgi:lysophospholipase L1-like esterase
MPRNKVRGIGIFGAVAALLAAGAASAAGPSCPATPADHIALRATRVALFHARPITIVALGSSSTEGAGATSPDATYPARLAAVLRSAWTDEAVTVLNRGVGGQMVDSVLPRIDTDVLAEQPTLVIWQVGTNEELRGMDQAQFTAQLDEGVERILASGADLILMDSQIAPRIKEDRLTAYDAIIAHEAEERHVPLFSRTALMREWQMADPPAQGMIGGDGLHHTDRGYACLAASLGQAIIASAAKGIPVATVKTR